MKNAEENRKRADSEAQLILEKAGQELEKAQQQALAHQEESFRIGKELLADAKKRAEELKERMIQDAKKAAITEIEEKHGHLIRENSRREQELAQKTAEMAHVRGDADRLKVNAENLKARTLQMEEQQTNLQTHIANLERQSEEIQSTMRKLAMKRQTMTDELHQFARQRTDSEKNLQHELFELKKKYEGEFRKVEEGSNQKIQAFIEDETKRIQALSRQMMDELTRTQESFSNQIHKDLWILLLGE
ncbi:MAG: hypothetical protein C5B49_07305, partial [Bdellovibrio sp.]